MGDIAKFSLLGTVGRITVGGLVGFGAMTATLASPTTDHRSAPAKPGLDLRPAKMAMDAVPAKSAAAGFPSALHRHTLGRQEEIDLPSMGSGNTQERIQSRAEVFARRVHREGLPLARLWENDAALLSLGLNKKGKPGLWIIQKVR